MTPCGPDSPVTMGRGGGGEEAPISREILQTNVFFKENKFYFL